MAECQENPLSIEEKEGEIGNKLAVDASENDRKTHEKDGKERKLEGSDHAVHGSKRTNSTCDVDIRENSSRQEPDARKCKDHSGNSTLEASQESGEIRRQHDLLLYAKREGLMSGSGGKELSEGDPDETRVGQGKVVTVPGDSPTSYLQAAKTNIPQDSYSMGATEFAKVTNG